MIEAASNGPNSVEERFSHSDLYFWVMKAKYVLDFRDAVQASTFGHGDDID